MKKNLPVPQEVRARLKMMSGYYEAKNALSQSRFPVVKKSYVIKSDGDEIDEMTDRVNGILEGEVTKLRDHALGVIERFVNSLEVVMCDFLKEHGVEPVDLVLGNDPFWRLKELPMVITTYGFEERLIFKGLGDLLLTRGKIMGLDEYPGFAVSALDNVFEAGVSSVFKKMGIIIKDEKKTELLTAEGSDA
ncbi:MAG TPA: hypothetical protein PLW37_14360 [bacterium]|nr:hypothetical protein [bacterium]HQB11043.1 hypothetical protein [bacterium]